jgi:hypothetical protein
MASDSALPPVIGAIATDRDGNPLGTITTVFLDDATQRPTWVGLTEGMHAAPDDAPVIAPLTGARFTDGRLLLTVPADAVRSAPPVSQPDRLSPAEETMLREHYAGATGGAGVGGPAASTDDAMTRSEERLQVSTVVQPWTRAVLRIEEVTEEVLVPVTITRQQARIEYLPLRADDRDRPPSDAAPAGADRPTSTTAWVTLYAEQPSVTLQRVPAERVRLRTAWVSEETEVSEQLRREEIEFTTSETPRS